MVEPFGLAIGVDVKLHDSHTIGTRDTHSAFAAVYFGGPNQNDLRVISDLTVQSMPIIPTVRPNGNFIADIPDALHGTNGLQLREDDPDLTELAVSLLECVGLLRRQRRIFISYRRVESSSAALQLHDLLSARGFDVFLDAHDIRPGEPFQEVMWNRLCDSDVMVMLDTPTYFDSKWTRQEIGRARAKGIQVLRVIWPAHTPSKLTDLSETIYLKEMKRINGTLTKKAADHIVLTIESLRSRSIAARYMAITGKLRADVMRIGATIEGIGAHRAISIRLLDDRRVWAYPIVGTPTADLFHEVADKARRANQREAPILVYDHLGIRELWVAHLKWLDDNIRSVRAIRVSDAGYILAAWEG
jgi:TIR domain